MFNVSRVIPRTVLGLTVLFVLLAQGGAAGAAPPAAGAGRVIYLAADGVTIKSIKPDGTDPRTLYTVSKPRGQTVSNLTADPTGSNILYSVSSDVTGPSGAYYLLRNGVVRKLPYMKRIPQWSPDGKRFVGQTASAAGVAGRAYIYNVTNNTSLYLPFTGLPDWFPDGNRLVYTDGEDVFTYNRTSGAITRLTRLPHQQNANDWYIEEAHVLPDGKGIVFFGQESIKNGQFQLGASGNGLQWFWIPVGGAPQPWLDPEGNGLVAYSASAAANKIAYSGSAHSSACASVQAVSVVYTDRSSPGQAVSLDIRGYNENADRYVYIKGLAWSPSGKQLAYGVQLYTCGDASAGQVLEASAIYISAAPDRLSRQAPRAVKLVSGTYPVWVK